MFMCAAGKAEDGLQGSTLSALLQQPEVSAAADNADAGKPLCSELYYGHTCNSPGHNHMLMVMDCSSSNDIWH